MKTKILMAGAAVGALALGTVAWLRTTPESVGSHEVQTPAPRSLFSNLVSRPHRCVMAPHARDAWVLTTQTGATATADSLGRASTLQTRNTGDLRATLQIEGLDALDDGSVVLARLVDVDAQTLEAAPGVAETPFLFKLTSRCEIAGFARHQSAPLLAARTQQATLAQLWFRVPTGSNVEDALGENALGTYRAALARDTNVVQRRTMAYERAWASAEVPRVGDALLAVTLSEEHWFDSMHGTEVVSHSVFPEAHSTFHAARTAVDQASLSQASRDQHTYVWENLLPRVVLPAALASSELSPHERAARAALVDKPFSEAVREFAASVAAEPNTDAKWRGLARYFDVHPEAVESFVGAMQHPDFPGELKAMGFIAVGHALPHEARDALAAVRANTSADPYDRIRATLSLVSRRDVGVELAKALRSDAQAMSTDPNSAQGFYGRNALLALGMFSALHSSDSPSIATEARAAVSDALSASSLPRSGEPAITFPAAMGAIGNLGDASDLPTIIELSKHPNPDVRAHVPQAMRRLKQHEVAAFTLEWLQRETSPEVKKELYSVIQHQLLDEQAVATEALARQAVQDLATQPLLLTRQPLVRLLGPVASTYPFVRHALVAQAVKEVGTTSGLYSVIAQFVPGEEVSVALSSHPSFRGQGRLLDGAPPAIPLPGTSTGVTP